MTSQLPLSVFIITKDEEDRILPAIHSVQGLSDDIVVVDSGSTDATVTLAKGTGARVIHHDWEGYGPQKRFAEDKCKHDWILNIDADERITPQLADEIRATFAGDVPELDGYSMDIVEMYPHERAPSRYAFSYDPVRLYNRAMGRYSDSSVHDRVQMDPAAKTAHLNGKVLHYSVRSLSHFNDKLNRYTDMQATDWVARGKCLGKWRLLVEFPAMFFKAYILRKNIMLGWYGFCISMAYAYFRFSRLAKVYEAGLPNVAKEG